MKKKMSVMISVILIAVFGFYAFASSEDVNWSHVSDEHYKKLPVKTSDPIVEKHLQDSDYIETLESLVDQNVDPADLSLYDDEDSHMVDNMLPDGRYLLDDWMERQQGLLKARAHVTTLSTLATSSQFNKNGVYTFDFSREASSDVTQSISFQKLMIDNKVMMVPLNWGSQNFEWYVTPNKEKSIIANEYGIWLMDPSSNQINQISPNSYQNKTIEELIDKSMELYGEDLIVWNADVSLAPNSEKLVYVSNKNSFQDGGTGVFMLDLNNKSETLLAYTQGRDNLIEGWINEDVVLCQSIARGDVKYVAIDMSGEEVILDLLGDDPTVYSVQDNQIAYCPDYCNTNEMYIAKYNGTSTPEIIKRAEMGVETRLQVGTQGFSPDNKCFACLYLPENNHSTRYVQIVSLVGNEIIEIDSFPKACGDTAYIHRFAWIDDKTLLINIGEEIDGNLKITTWTYSIFLLAMPIAFPR